MCMFAQNLICQRFATLGSFIRAGFNNEDITPIHTIVLAKYRVTRIGIASTLACDIIIACV